MRLNLRLFLIGILIFFFSYYLIARSENLGPDPKKLFLSLSFPFMQLYHYWPDSNGTINPESKIAFPAGVGFMLNYVVCKNFMFNIPVLINADKSFDAFNISTGFSFSSIIFSSKVVGMGFSVDIIRKQDNGYEVGLFSEKHKKPNLSLLFQFGFPVSYESPKAMMKKELAKVKKLEQKDPQKAKESLIKAFRFAIQENKKAGNIAKAKLFEEKLNEVTKEHAEEIIIKENREYLQQF